jgi:CHAT domain-containing protein
MRGSRFTLRRAGALLAWLAGGGAAPVALRAQSPAEAAAAVAAAAAHLEAGSAAARRDALRARLALAPADRLAALELATHVRLAYDYARADSLLGALAAGPADAVAAYAALGRARSLTARGLLREAGAALDAATPLVGAGGAGARVELLLARAWVRARVAGAPAALATLDSAQRLVGGEAGEVAPGEHARLRAAIYCLRAANSAGQPGAHALVDSGLAAGDSLPRVTRASCQFARGMLHAGAGQMARAYAALDSAEGAFRAAGDRATLSALHQWRGYALLSVGEHARARRELALALAEGAASDALIPTAWALVNVGATARVLGDARTAAEYAARAAALFERVGDESGVAQARDLAAAAALEGGDRVAARAGFAANARWAAAAGSWMLGSRALRGLAYAAMGAGEWDAAAALLDSSSALLLRHGGARWAPSSARDRAQLALRRGDGARAERELRAALPSFVAAQTYARYEIFASLAEARLQQGDAADAAAVLRDAGDALDAWRASVGDERLRALAFQTRDGFEARASAERVIAGVAAAGRVAEALALAERRRARALADALLRAGGARAGAPVPGSAAADAGAALPADGRTALLQFVGGRGDAPTTLFVVTRAGARAHLLPAGDALRAPAERLAERAGRAQRLAEVRGVARELGAALLGAALRTLPAGVTRLVVVPDGALHLVPFELLDPDGRGPLGARYAVSLAPSATTLALLRGRAAPPRAPTVLALGAPDFGDVAGGADAARGEAPAPLAPLPASAGEARDAARLAPGSRVLLGRDASEAALRRLPAEGFAVLHLATHALVDDAQPWATMLVLAPGGGEDGFVRAHELSALPLRADLVVLSACRSVGGYVAGGEGVQGFAAPLLAGGARAVVASRWAVRDAEAARFMGAFYAALRAGATAGDALARAARARRAAGAPPREWAAFTLVGDAAVRPGR